MKSILITTTLISAFMLTASCSHEPILVSNECGNLDWFEQGRRAGISGETHPGEGLTLNKCTPSEDQRLAFNTGYHKGVSQYCRPTSAMALGKAGVQINPICPPDVKSKFMDNYNLGLEIFKLRREQELLQSQIDNLFRLLTVQSLSQLERESLNDQLSTLENQQSKLSRRLDRLQTPTAN